MDQTTPGACRASHSRKPRRRKPRTCDESLARETPGPTWQKHFERLLFGVVFCTAHDVGRLLHTRLFPRLFRLLMTAACMITSIFPQTLLPSDCSWHFNQRSEAMTHDGWFTGSMRVDPTAVARRPPPSPYAALWGAAAPHNGEGFQAEVGGVSLGRHRGGGGGLVPSPGSAGGAKQHSFTLDHQHTLELQHTCPKVWCHA